MWPEFFHFCALLLLCWRWIKSCFFMTKGSSFEEKFPTCKICCSAHFFSSCGIFSSSTLAEHYRNSLLVKNEWNSLLIRVKYYYSLQGITQQKWPLDILWSELCVSIFVCIFFLRSKTGFCLFESAIWMGRSGLNAERQLRFHLKWGSEI